MKAAAIIGEGELGAGIAAPGQVGQAGHHGPALGIRLQAVSEAGSEAGGQTVVQVPLGPEAAVSLLQPGAPPPGGIPSHVTRNLVSGTSAMGAGALIERGMGFLANILAARFGGASTFGAYSLGITTAANISTYAAGGIGSTAARFSGKYPRGTAGYPRLARALIIVSVVSATLAAAGLWFGASPLAHILHKESLAPLLRWAAFSAAGMILLECARGFFVGQRRLAALLLLSLIVGLGMVLLLPLAATRHNPSQMILSQATITVSAVVLCLLLARPLGLLAQGGAGGTVGSAEVQGTEKTAATEGPSARSVGPILGEVWSFGMVQLAGLIGMNLAGWWLTTLVARADTTLVQMSFFAIANQMRNIVGLGPSLLTESSYAIMAASDHSATTGGATAGSRAGGATAGGATEVGVTAAAGTRSQTPDQVMALCTYFATGSSLVLSALGILIVPWGLTLLYGHAFRAGAITTAIGLAIAIVHMGNSPAAARLTIVSIRTAGAINTAWALMVAGIGTALLLRGGTAWQAMSVYLGAHLLSATLVLFALVRHRCVPAGMISVIALGALTSVALAALAYVRDVDAALTWPLTALMLVVIAAALAALAHLGKRHHWLPRAAAVRDAVRGFVRAWAASIKARLRPTRHAHGA